METISFVDRSKGGDRFVTKNLAVVSNVFCFFDQYKHCWIVSIADTNGNTDVVGVFDGTDTGTKANARNLYDWICIKVRTGKTISEDAVESMKESLGGK